jgi:hypothetical protein
VREIPRRAILAARLRTVSQPRYSERADEGQHDIGKRWLDVAREQLESLVLITAGR